MRRGKVITTSIRLPGWAEAIRFIDLAKNLLGAKVTAENWSDGESELRTGRLSPGQVEVLRRLSKLTQVDLTWDDYRRELDKAREETESLLEDLNRLAIADLSKDRGSR